MKHRVLPGPGGGEVQWTLELTPYIEGIQDAGDVLGVQVLAVKGPARSGKTVAGENRALKHWIYGPSVNVLWYMQSREDVEDYVEERVEWMLENHEAINAKVNWSDRRNSRSRKRIGTSLARWLAATKGTTRGKAAPLIIADEIDGYTPAVRRSILTRLINRQREFGTQALAYICSHPDEGPAEGIDAVLRECVTHLWHWQCQECGLYSSPSPEAEHRMTWNVAGLLEKYIELDRGEMLDRVEAEARLACPHCDHEIGDEPSYRDSERYRMNASGVWLQEHQKVTENGEITGEARTAEKMGFTIHGFMSPFVTIGGLAREWANAKAEFDRTGQDTGLKEVVVKSLGETYAGTDTEKQIESWSVVKSRLRGGYLMRTVPEGVRFLTAFVDIQGDRFEVRVIGWSADRESWLIDSFPIKQAPPDPETGRPAFDTIDPAHRLSDWNVIEDAVIRQSYPLADQPHMHLPIAKVAVDTGGEGETTVNARKWAGNIVGRKDDPVPNWRVLLTKGAASKKGELYGKPKKQEFDDTGKPLEAAIWERTVNVHELKGIIALRMKIDVPGPGKMHLPVNIPDRLVRELTAEQLINDDWVAIRARNETWDAWVACEVARETLQPVRGRPINWARPPGWAKPFEIGKEKGINASGRSRPGYWDRISKINRANKIEE